MRVLQGPMALTFSAVETLGIWKRDIVGGQVGSTLKTQWRHCEAGTMDGLSNVYIQEVVAPAVKKVTSRIVKIDRQNSIKETLTQLQNLFPISFTRIELQLSILQAPMYIILNT